MARVRLTAGRVSDFHCPPKAAQAFLWDTGAPGLAIRATEHSKAFVFQGRLRGSSLRITIGDVRARDIDSDDPEHPGARQEARRLQTLLDQGIDPREHRAEKDKASANRKQENARGKTTFAEAWQVYVDARRAGWGARHLADHEHLAQEGGADAKRGKRKTTPGPLAPLRSLSLREINDLDRLKAWLAGEVARRPTQTRLAFGALRAFANWCAENPIYRGIVDPQIFESQTLRGILPRKNAKSDCLQREQLRAWFAAVRDIDNPTVAAYLQALLLTGARRDELAQLTWSNVDFRWNSLTIRDKVEGERIIPLTPYVASLLRDLKVRNDSPPTVKKLRPSGSPDQPAWRPSAWVFSSASSKLGWLQEPRFQHNRALRVAGINGLTLHGLRRSFGTLSEWVECPVGIVAQIMGHKPSATAEKHYRVRPLDLLRAWHVKIEGWMLAEARIEFVAEVDPTALRLAQG